ncbi:LRR repeat protein [Cryptosporidium bovis]|uniref:LRR repeat protein n=1 Tax=Cryptosporidium bovis TaxID=310047 RepID=UPI003519E92E|nr:LRR repeat protein [Cryptosporidium bovis]
MTNIGDRVLSINNEKVGTIRSIDFNETSEPLFGIEWDPEPNDEPDEKSVCKVTSKLQFYNKDLFNTGISFQDALIDRYLSDDGNLEFFVGLKKAYEYCRRLSSLSLEKMNISYCSCNKLEQNYEKSLFYELSTCLKNIESIYLNDNLISNWETVYCILSHLKNAKYLVLNGNQIMSSNEGKKFIFDKIRVLSLSKTSIEFEQITSMCNENSVFPNVEYINVSSNKYLSLNVKNKNGTIKEIDISYNMLDNWEMFRSRILENFIKLSAINISNNNFMNIPEIDSKSDVKHVYPNIAKLIMDGCGLETLNSILYISRAFPNLEEISLRSNRIFKVKNRYYDVRSIIISLFPNIKTYNKSILKQDDIISSQRYYISQYLVHMNSDLREMDPNSDILLNFMSKNIFNNSENVNIEERPPEAKYIELTFMSKFKQSEKLTPTIKINRKITVSEIKVLISRLYKIPRSKPLKLIFENDNMSINIDEYSNTLTLSDIGINDSGNISILDSTLN